MMDRLLLFLLIIGCIATLSMAMRGSSPRRTRMPGRTRPGTRPPPPVPEDFTSCEAQAPHIRCEEDGSFSAVQCSERRPRMCYCVNTTTGRRLNDREMFPERERDTFNCSAVQQCPDRECNKVCAAGYEVDREGCETCMCQRAPVVESCETITALVAGGCACACVEITDPAPGTPRMRSRATKGCPQCRDSCNATTTEEVSPRFAAQCPTGSECKTNETVLSVGPHGVEKCVRLLPPDEMCSTQAKPAPIESQVGRRKPAGARERKAVGLVGEASTPCQMGHVCRRVGLMERRCRPEDPNAPCVRRRDDPTNPDPDAECDDEGNFKPLQCGPVEGTPRSRLMGECRCVRPNGSTVEGTGARVRPGRPAPDCEREVFRRCEVPRGRGQRRLRVYHGETYFDAEGCRACECRDGNATAFCSEPGNCSVVARGEADCVLSEESGGGVIPHGGTRRFGCQVCGCRDGRLRCARPRCPEEEEEEEDSCRACEKGPPAPVCGPNGINYRSICVAVNCSRIPPADLENGPCQSHDVCERFPCEEGKMCVPKGGVACIGTKGCQSDQRRTCVDLEDLQCPANETVFGIVENEVCGTNNITYPSVCSLLQSTSGVRVAHPGACNRPECGRERICGRDGVSYPNICVFRSLGTAILDYVGDCEDNCTNVRDTGRCTHNDDNCDTIVQPRDGCCPICGGTVSIALDREALDDVAQTDPDVGTVDGFVERMTDSELFEKIVGNCTLEATLTSTGDMEILLGAVSPRDAESSQLCNKLAEDIADAVNNETEVMDSNDLTRQLTPQEEGVPTGIVELPQVYDFAMAAATAPVIVKGTTDATATTTQGGAGLVPSFLVTMVILLSGLLLLY